MTPRFLIVVFDGMRPDLVSEAQCPRLADFLRQGSRFPRSRSVFPSATRVNATALGSGAPPTVNGIVSNKFYDPRAIAEHAVHTGLAPDLAALEAAYGGQLVTGTTLGEVLAAHGQKMAVVSTGSGGTTRLVNPRAAELGHVTLGLRDWSASTPKALADELLAAHGPIPAAEMPNTPRIRLQVELFLREVYPREQPAVSLLWISDPDSTFHHQGLGSAVSNAALRGADEQFGRLLDWWQGGPLKDELQVLVLSDHGHITARKRVHVQAAFAEAGLRFGEAFGPGVDYVGALGYQGAITVRDGDPALLARLVAVLREQPWCGLIFTAGGNGVEGGVPGTLDRDLLGVSHERAPHLYYVMRNDDGANAQGVPGSCFFDSSEYDEGGSTHGGLHAMEMNNLLVAQGSLFKQGEASDLPAGIVDVAPTVLHLLGLPIPPSMTGRVLHEALRQGAAPPQPDWRTVAVGEPPRRQVLRYAQMGSHRYLESGWLE